jgi:hypothetical protein
MKNTFWVIQVRISDEQTQILIIVLLSPVVGLL